MLVHEAKWAILVSWFVMIRMIDYPVELGRFTIKSRKIGDLG